MNREYVEVLEPSVKGVTPTLTNTGTDIVMTVSANQADEVEIIFTRDELEKMIEAIDNY